MPNAGFFILVKIENRILKKSQLKDKLAEKKGAQKECIYNNKIIKRETTLTAIYAISN